MSAERFPFRTSTIGGPTYDDIETGVLCGDVNRPIEFIGHPLEATQSAPSHDLPRFCTVAER